MCLCYVPSGHYDSFWGMICFAITGLRQLQLHTLVCSPKLNLNATDTNKSLKDQPFKEFINFTTVLKSICLSIHGPEETRKGSIL